MVGGVEYILDGEFPFCELRREKSFWINYRWEGVVMGFGYVLIIVINYSDYGYQD